MNIVGTEGNSVRQIVPAEFNFLSMADRQVVAALERVLKVMFGIAENQAVVVSGFDITKLLVREDNELTNTATIIGWRYMISEGVVMWNGCLWEFGGGSFERSGAGPVLLEGYALVMSEVVAQPSPVYGENITLDVTPHKRAVCTLMSAEDAAQETQKVFLNDVRRIGTVVQRTSVGGYGLMSSES